MDLIQFIYLLIGKHVAVNPAQFALLEKEARNWYDTEATKTKLGEKVKSYSETFWCKTLLALIFIFASRWMFDFMNPQIDQDEHDDED